MRVVRAVVRREYLERVRSRWFLLTTLAAPLLVLLLVAVPLLLDAPGSPGTGSISVLDHTGVLAERVEEGLVEAGFAVEGSGRDDPREAERELARRVTEGVLGGFLVLDAETLERGAARYVGGALPPFRRAAVRGAVVRAALEARLEAGGGEDVRALLEGGELELSREPGRGGGAVGDDPLDSPAFTAVFAGTFLLYVALLFYAVAVMRSVLEEKTSRIVEVIVSAVEPWKLMLGKILGVGAVGLTQLAIWALVAGALAAAGLPALVAARPELAGLAELGGVWPGVGVAGLFLLYFLGGYFIYAGLYAAVGAMCTSEQEASQAQAPIVLLLAVPVLLLAPVMEAPGSTFATLLSLVPFFSPILMFARAGLGVASGWEVALSAVLMAGTVVVVARLAGRIYRTGILMTGKRPTLPELWRWIRKA